MPRVPRVPRGCRFQQRFGGARLHGRRELVIERHPRLTNLRRPARVQYFGKHPEQGPSHGRVMGIDNPVPHMPGAERAQNPVEFGRLVEQRDGSGEHFGELFRLGFDLGVEHRPKRRVNVEQVLVEDQRGDARMRLDHGKARPQEMDLMSFFETHDASIVARRPGAIPTLVGAGEESLARWRNPPVAQPASGLTSPCS